MDAQTKLDLTAALQRGVANFAFSVPGTEHLALEDIRLTVRKAEHKLATPVLDPGHSPFDDDEY